jgi:hypothetical protein
MTTITSRHQGVPLIAALAVGATLVVGGAIGAARDQTIAPAASSAHQPTPSARQSWDPFGRSREGNLYRIVEVPCTPGLC